MGRPVSFESTPTPRLFVPAELVSHRREGSVAESLQPGSALRCVYLGNIRMGIVSTFIISREVDKVGHGEVEDCVARRSQDHTN